MGARVVAVVLVVFLVVVYVETKLEFKQAVKKLLH